MTKEWRYFTKWKGDVSRIFRFFGSLTKLVDVEVCINIVEHNSTTKKGGESIVDNKFDPQ